jgi:hypothetical protein
LRRLLRERWHCFQRAPGRIRIPEGPARPDTEAIATSYQASSFEVAIMLAAMTKGVPAVGVVWDNLATVRRLQKRWPDAEQASDRAIAALETIDDPKARKDPRLLREGAGHPY